MNIHSLVHFAFETPLPLRSFNDHPLRGGEEQYSTLVFKRSVSRSNLNLDDGKNGTLVQGVLDPFNGGSRMDFGESQKEARGLKLTFLEDVCIALCSSMTKADR